MPIATRRFVITLFLFAACDASTASRSAKDEILDALAEEYPLAALTDPDQTGNLGGLNMWAYCLSRGYPAVGYQKGYVEGPNGAYDNWVCQRGTEQLEPTDTESVDMVEACRWQFDRQQIEASPEDPNHAWSWICIGV